MEIIYRVILERTIRSWEQSTMSSVSASAMLRQENSSLETNPITRTTKNSWTFLNCSWWWYQARRNHMTSSHKKKKTLRRVSIKHVLEFAVLCVHNRLTPRLNHLLAEKSLKKERNECTSWPRRQLKGLCIRFVNNNHQKNYSHPNDDIELGSREMIS